MQQITLRKKRSGERSGVPWHRQAERGLLVHPQRGATRNERIIDELLVVARRIYFCTHYYLPAYPTTVRLDLACLPQWGSCSVPA
jgi:hypothetical protein